MLERTEQTTIRFSSPFSLPGLHQSLPAGEYRLEQVWEPVEGLTQTGYRRTGTFLHLPAIGAASLVQQAVPVDIVELQSALERDRTP
jgi:hypothetical protein